MPKFRTHYDNLKVSRDAPIEVIQAAYRSLARKYHPDRNGSKPEGESMMKTINASYEVLSDPAKRAEHDRWISDTLNRGGFQPPRADVTGRHAQEDDGPSSSGHDAAELSQRVVTVILSVLYFTTALWMLRNPGSRFIGLVLLVAGWLFLKTRRR